MALDRLRAIFNGDVESVSLAAQPEGPLGLTPEELAKFPYADEPCPGCGVPPGLRWGGPAVLDYHCPDCSHVYRERP